MARPAKKQLKVKVSKSSKKQTKKAGLGKLPVILIVTVIALVVVCGGVWAVNFIQQKGLEDKIQACVTETKFDPLGFVSECYERNDQKVPEDIKNADKARVDRILAQEAYDTCMANAQLYRDALWDLNDNDPQNGDIKDSIASYHTDFVQNEYQQRVEECKMSAPLKDAYEADFKTYYRKELVGWKEPKEDKIPIINRYNLDGKITAASGIPSDEPVDEGVGTVGGNIAREFKDTHKDWWY